MDLKKIDAKYKEFPSLEHWLNVKIDKSKWDAKLLEFNRITKVEKSVIEHANKIVRRYAAVETGAIEKLYDFDRGLTWNIACELADISILLEDKDANVEKIVTSQLEGYDYVLDFATKSEIITESWIRELHKVLCKSQQTYSVITNQGKQEHELPLGEYKVSPNHVMQKDGKWHSYAPVDMVGYEMNRLVEQMKSAKFEKLHPALQAAFVHYSLVWIHPFADGNGRAARALASVFLYRGMSIPLLVLAEDRLDYINSLESADSGKFEKLVGFTINCCFNAIDLIEQSIQAGQKKDSDLLISEIDSFYRTKGGYTQEEVDKVAATFFNVFVEKLNVEFKKLRSYSNLANFYTGGNKSPYKPFSENHRMFIQGQGEKYTIQVASKPPKKAVSAITLSLHIPTDCDKNDDFIIINEVNKERINARINELLPNIKPSLHVKMDIFIESTVKSLIEILYDNIKVNYYPD